MTDLRGFDMGLWNADPHSPLGVGKYGTGKMNFKIKRFVFSISWRNKAFFFFFCIEYIVLGLCDPVLLLARVSSLLKIPV